jgi:hypothetical protein
VARGPASPSTTSRTATSFCARSSCPAPATSRGSLVSLPLGRLYVSSNEQDEVIRGRPAHRERSPGARSTAITRTACG